MTGASRGIGAEIALCLARNGAKVVVNYVQNQSAADRVCEKIRQHHGECIAVQADISDSTEVAELFLKPVRILDQSIYSLITRGSYSLKKSRISLTASSIVSSMSISRVFFIPCAKLQRNYPIMAAW